MLVNCIPENITEPHRIVEKIGQRAKLLASVFPKTKRIFRQLTDENKSAPIYLLAGVTAAGKSQIALNWAEANQSHICHAIRSQFIKGWILVQQNQVKMNNRGCLITA